MGFSFSLECAFRLHVHRLAPNLSTTPLQNIAAEIAGFPDEDSRWVLAKSSTALPDFVLALCSPTHYILTNPRLPDCGLRTPYSLHDLA
jgi:hypothetical protein